MPSVNKHDPKKPQKLKVEQLLQLKKAERPDQDFWHDFERSMHQRMFQQALNSRPSLFRRAFNGVITSKITAFAAPGAAAAVVFGAIVMNPAIPAGSSDTSASTLASNVDIVIPVKASAIATNSQSQKTFVSDSLQANMDNGRFVKVMANSGMSYAKNSSARAQTRFAADNLAAGGNILFASTSF